MAAEEASFRISIEAMSEGLIICRPSSMTKLSTTTSGPALHAVADYDEFFDFDCGLLECGVESGLSLGHRNLKGFVSDKGEYEHGVFACDMDCIHTVGVGRGPGCSSFDQDGYAGYASRFVGDRAGYFTCLGLCLEALRQHCDGKCETYKYGFCHFVCF